VQCAMLLTYNDHCKEGTKGKRDGINAVVSCELTEERARGSSGRGGAR